MEENTPPRGERTQSEIVQTAHRLFLKNGYHGTSMRQIAEGAGIALGGIYNHFPSKEDIYLAVLKEHHPYMNIVPAMMSAQGEDLESLLRDAAHRMVAALNDRLDFLNLMFIELVEFDGRHISMLFEIIFPEVMVFARRMIQDRDELRPIPPPTLMRAFLGLFFSYTLTEILMGKQMPPEMSENALDHFVDIYLYGILKDGRTQAETRS
jgi:AcrR family transcriptional regulator